MTSSRLVVVLAALVAGSSACTSKEASSTHDSASAANAGSLEGARKADSSGKGSGAAGMPGMAGMPSMVGSAMMDSMQAHMRMMTKPELKQAMPAHLARVSRVMQIHKVMMAKMGK